MLLYSHKPFEGRERVSWTHRRVHPPRWKYSSSAQSTAKCDSDANEASKLGPERFRAPEILFNPELIGQEYAGVHQVVVDSIQRVDLDLRKSLFSNIVLSGGSTLCKGKLCICIWLSVCSTPT